LIQGNADLVDGFVTPRIWTTQVTKQCFSGDLIMSVRAPAGAMGKTRFNGVIGRGVASIRGNEFLYQALVKMDSNGYWKSLSCGSTFESLNSNDIKDAIIKVPNNREQEKIGSLLLSLDSLIALHQRKADSILQVKKFLLANLFC
jgi:type I restriction enzyme S subunit